MRTLSFGFAFGLVLSLVLLGCTQNPAGQGQEASQRIQAGDIVMLEYTGFVDGRVFDTSNATLGKQIGIPKDRFGPWLFTVGAGQILPGIDQSVIGMRVGQNKTVELTPDQAFGFPKKEWVKILNRSVFGNATLEPGLLIQNEQGPLGVIRKIDGDEVTMDLNNPLAGRNVTFDLRVVSARRPVSLNASDGPAHTAADAPAPRA